MVAEKKRKNVVASLGSGKPEWRPVKNDDLPPPVVEPGKGIKNNTGKWQRENKRLARKKASMESYQNQVGGQF